MSSRCYFCFIHFFYCQELVNNITTDGYVCRPALWHFSQENGGSNLVSLKPGRYEIDFQAIKPVTVGPTSSHHHTKMELYFNKTSNKTSESQKVVITFKY